MARLRVDKQVIRDLAALLNETGLTEIEWSEGDTLVRVGRGGSPAGNVTMTAPAPLPAVGEPVDDAGGGEPAAESEDLSQHVGAIASPMVGTVYVSPEPGTAPFVSVGDSVSEGQTVIIIEAMKTMNPIPAPRGGRVSHILVGNEQPVEFGQVLMIIE
jgi:acetyl-CoA carboxylase biotin carboxyl carrier protein